MAMADIHRACIGALYDWSKRADPEATAWDDLDTAAQDAAIAAADAVEVPAGHDDAMSRYQAVVELIQPILEAL